MTSVNLDLKDYQTAALSRLRNYLMDCVATKDCATAFYNATGLLYRAAPIIDKSTPYICLRIPTGGGKTIMAAHSIGIAAHEFTYVTNPMILWLVPSTPILDQTITALKSLDHPYRNVLSRDFGRNIMILTRDEALTLSRADAEGNACIVVSTIQSFRREKRNGDTDIEGLKAYQDAGRLMEHFSNLSEAQERNLEKIEGTNRPAASLVNLLRLHRPMIIVDEAHGARTQLSFDTIARFSPSLILELTATPKLEHDVAKGNYASNVLYSASASELKAAQMIKMPIRLTTDKNWQRTIDAALDCQATLEKISKIEENHTGEYIRPVVLIQAQSASKSDQSRLTFDKIEKFLIDKKNISKDKIAVHTGERKDLDKYNILSSNCEIRYIITVQKLKEGWDCPFAYVLCSVSEQMSPTAIEQILGRILRLPSTKRKAHSYLNYAYAYVASASFDSTARKLRDGLVEGAGFSRLETDDFVTNLGMTKDKEIFDNTEYASESIDRSQSYSKKDINQIIKKLPSKLKNNLTHDTQRSRFLFKGIMTLEQRNLLHLAFKKMPGVMNQVEQLYIRSNKFNISSRSYAPKVPFVVPLLGISTSDGKVEQFSREHFLKLPWKLEECESSSIIEKFKIDNESQEGQIDVTKDGKVEIDFYRRVREDLSAVTQEPAWSLPTLVNWIDAGITHLDVTKPSASKFIVSALNDLIEYGYNLDTIARYKYDLRRAMSVLISDLRSEREKEMYEALITSFKDKFIVDLDMSILFDEQNYAFNQPYGGSTKLKKHYMPLIGDLRSEGEEFECAVHLDRHNSVKYWIRNVESKPSSFWLQLPHGKFYPDFIALCKDDRILVVEYKGKHLYKLESDKRRIGEIWARSSNGRCLFCMPTDRKFDIIDDTISSNGRYKV